RVRDRAALAVLLGGDAGVGPGRVDEADQREAVPLRKAHRAHRLAVTLRIAHPELPLRPLLDVSPLLLADEHDRAAVEAADPGDHRAVVGPPAVPVQLDPVLEDPRDVVQRVRAVRVPRELDGAPDLLVRRLRLELLELTLQALELAGELRAAEERGAAQ